MARGSSVRGYHPPSTPARLLGMLAILALLFAGWPARHASAHHEFVSWIPFPDQSTAPKAFGPGQAITIAWGAVEYLSNDLTPGVCNGGSNDFVVPRADIYVVPSGKVYRNSSVRLALRPLDPAGVPNAVEGGDGGYFFDETIGYTLPAGGTASIGAGSWAIVYDECQDGYFDDNVDFLLDPAFTVSIPVSVPPLDTTAVTSLKRSADAVAQIATGNWITLKSLLLYDEISEKVNCILTAGQIGSLGACIDMLAGVLEEQFVGWDDVNDFVLDYDLAIARHYGGISADPPDLVFRQLTSLAAVTRLTSPTRDPVYTAAAALGNTGVTEAALAEALLHSLERYQGARDASDGDWALIHARAIRAYATALMGQLAQTNTTLSSLNAAIATDTQDLDTVATSFRTFRSRVGTSGFAADELAALHALGLSDAAIDKLKSDILALDFPDFSKAAAQSALSQMIAANTADATSLDGLAMSMDSLIGSLKANPLVSDTIPTANAGGPYTGREGTAIAFNGSASTSASTITTYQWDLDGDGTFDDATGATPSFTYTGAFQGLVGLKVTDAAGRSNIAYAPIAVANVNSPPTITTSTPAGTGLQVSPGGTQTFSVTTSDPDGDAVSIQWVVDGTAAGTGTAFTYSPTAAQAGLHTIEAVATDASPLGGAVRQSWIVAVPAAATSANLGVTQTAAPDQPRVGQALTYTITVANTGPAAATGVTLTDTLPSGVTFVSAAAGQGSCSGTATVTCQFGSLPAGTSTTATIVVTPSAVGTLSNTARVTATEPDPIATNNSTTLATSVLAADTLQIFDQGALFGGVFAEALGIAADSTSVYVVGVTNTSFPDSPNIGANDSIIRKYGLNGDVRWTRRIGTVQEDEVWAVAVDASGVYVAGWTDGDLSDPTNTTLPAFHGFIRKYSLDGAELWTRELPLSTSGTTITDRVRVAVDGTGVYIVGNVYGSVLGQPALGDVDAFVRKYGLDGDELWTRQFGGSSADIAEDLAVDCSGVYVSGISGSNVFVRKLSPSGGDLWARAFGSWGGGWADLHAGIAVDATGVYVGGSVNGALPGQTSAGDSDAFLRKYTVDGAELWTRQFGTAQRDLAGRVALDPTGVYIFGETAGPLAAQIPADRGFDFDTFVRKYDVNGAEVWTRQFVVNDNTIDFAHDIAVNAGGVYLAGRGFVAVADTVARLSPDQAGSVAPAALSCAAPADTTAPTTTAVASPDANAAGWRHSDVTVTLTAADEAGGSGVKEITYTLSGAQSGGATVAGGSITLTVTAEGTTTVTYYARDNAGNQEQSRTLTIKLDKTPPALTFGTPSPAPDANGWNTTDVAIPFTPADGTSGVDSTDPATSPLVLKGEGSAISGTVAVTDKAGNRATFTSPAVKIDRTASATTAVLAPLPNAAGWTNRDTTVTLTATDPPGGVGVQSITYSATGAQVIPSTTVSGSTATIAVTTDGQTTITYAATDAAGNRGAAETVRIQLDKSAPGPTTRTLSGGMLGANGWYTTPPSISLASHDITSGVATLYYQVVPHGDVAPTNVLPGAWTAYMGAFSAPGGDTDLYAFAIDAAGNAELPVALGELKVDTAAPMTTATGTLGTSTTAYAAGMWTNRRVTVALAATDPAGGAGVKQITYSASGAQSIAPTVVPGGAATLPTITAVGTTMVAYFAEDNAGNAAPVTTFMVRIEETPPTCVLGQVGTDAQGHPYQEMLIQDTESGLARVQMTFQVNVVPSIPRFTPGTTEPVTLRFTQDDILNYSTYGWDYKVFDVAGNVVLCDPVVVLASRDRGKPVTQTISNLPMTTSRLQVKNGTPGLTNLQVTVNEQRFTLGDLKDGEARTLDVSSAMTPGETNTIVMMALGKPGGTATIVLSDGGMPGR